VSIEAITDYMKPNPKRWNLLELKQRYVDVNNSFDFKPSSADDPFQRTATASTDSTAAGRNRLTPDAPEFRPRQAVAAGGGVGAGGVMGGAGQMGGQPHIAGLTGQPGLPPHVGGAPSVPAARSASARTRARQASPPPARPACSAWLAAAAARSRRA
jgi:hypothetical protein